MPKTSYTGWRFSVQAHADGGWAVHDAGYISAATNAQRIVAVCPDRREADAISAYLNNDPELGRRLFADCLSQLDHA
ncbi:hypothetical protein [Methylobacterium aquaticum]|uniref:hypothetical protein n=1 Tax=Methylobacterium aquaticum TaxID=270351 RepID=UPI001931A5FA|nr:hypothetical protein [Methylobacterium aquaticum]QRE78247.1 hypothetical protein F1D61_33000 [Methylobacterium aquaticum]QRE78267.1 hypothetical protein F1D61_33110 [Methylobacterium aquaticum]